MRPLLAGILAVTLLAVSVGPAPASQETRREPSAADGRALAAELGCGACHAGAPPPEIVRRRAPSLGAGGPALTPDFVFEYLGDPARRRTDIGATRMPDFRLDEGERLALALLLGRGSGGGALAAARGKYPQADAALGGRIYAALGCAGCHAGVGGTAPFVGPDLSREGARTRPQWLEPWLVAPSPIRGPAHPTAPGARMPDFRLTGAEAAALAAWIGGLGVPFEELPDRTLTPGQARRVDRWLDERGACLGCHRIGGRGGRVGPSLEAVAARLRPSFVLETILDPARAAPASPMPHQPVPPGYAELLARRILDLSAAEPPGGRHPAPRPSLVESGNPAWAALPAAAPDTSRGPALYARHCASCHGATGEGDGWNAAELPTPPARHADAAKMARRVDDALYDAIHAGGRVLDGSARMPGFGELLPPEDIRALVAHLRTLCACEAPAWSRDGRRRDR